MPTVPNKAVLLAAALLLAPAAAAQSLHLDRLETALETPATAVDCFVPVFKREIRGSQYGLALNEAVAHCLHLWHKGRATRTRRDDGAWLYEKVRANG